MIYKLILSGFLFLFGSLHLVRQVQMLQQNSYYISRYSKWAASHKADAGFVKAILVSLGFSYSYSKIDAVTTLILIACIIIFGLISVKKNKASIKPLVFTARVKRLFAAAIVIMTVFAALYVTFDGTAALIFKLLLLIFAFLPFVTAVLSVFVMSPVEKAVSNYYINDAKKLLKGHRNLKVIGVTGSYGKTSTKYILGRILSEKYNTLITPESFNTPMGVVRTVRESLRPQTEIFVCEMGAKQVGQIKEICKIADPDLAVITSVGPQHLDTFGSIENVLKTKFELADWVKEKNGKSFLNLDNELIKENANGYDYISYGTKNDADFVAKNISYSKNGVSFDVVNKDRKISLTSKLLGLHSVLNITCAVSVAVELGLSDDEIRFAVSKLKPISHRLELKPFLSGATLIDDAYNANPDGCLEAVRVLGSFEGMKKIIVTPGLVELGEKEYECNKALGSEAGKRCDVIILVGKKRSIPLADGVKETDFNTENLFVVDSFKEAYAMLQTICDNNTAVLFENDLPDNYVG